MSDLRFVKRSETTVYGGNMYDVTTAEWPLLVKDTNRHGNRGRNPYGEWTAFLTTPDGNTVRFSANTRMSAAYQALHYITWYLNNYTNTDGRS